MIIRAVESLVLSLAFMLVLTVGPVKARDSAGSEDGPLGGPKSEQGDSGQQGKEKNKKKKKEKKAGKKKEQKKKAHEEKAGEAPASAPVAEPSTGEQPPKEEPASPASAPVAEPSAGEQPPKEEPASPASAPVAEPPAGEQPPKEEPASPASAPVAEPSAGEQPPKAEPSASEQAPAPETGPKTGTSPKEGSAKESKEATGKVGESKTPNGQEQGLGQEGQEKKAQAGEKAGKQAGEKAGKEQAESKQEEEKKHFIKGELLDIGALDLLGSRNRAGARLGYRAINNVHYVTVEPEVDLRFGKFKLGLSGPLNIEIWDGSEGLLGIDTTGNDTKTKIKGFDNIGSIRSEDWDHWRDYFRILKYVNWGRKEDNLYINIGQSAVGSIGHGTIMKRYLPQVDLDTVRLGAQVDAYFDWLGGFEFYTNDITKANLIGVLGFIKPLAPFMESYLPKSLSFGFSFVTDRTAPTSLAVQQVDDNNDGTPDRDVVRLDSSQEDTLPKAGGTKAVSILGVDAELKVLKNGSTDIKIYTDFSKMLDAGYGLTAGILGRFNLGTKLVHAFRIRAEARYFTLNYMPSYFDSFYEIDRWQYMTGNNRYYSKTGGLPLTKYQAIKGAGDKSEFGYFLEFGYSIVNYVSLGGSIEGQAPDSNNNILLSLSVPWSDYARLAVTYQKRHFAHWKDMFDLTADDAWLSGLVRIKLLPILYLNGQVGHIWSLDREKYQSTSEPGPDYGLYKADFDWRVWLDVAYEFEL
ncbi:MAG: hypothetical protein GXP49_05945 [Deltaproteobacteria bacterium]|nr:hypothetical protein [Deltaproteobacteria bacterium]